MTEPNAALLEGSADTGPCWGSATRVSFRFACAYLTLYVVFTQIIVGLLPPVVPLVGTLPPMRTIVEWTALHVFHVTDQLTLVSGSGDKVYDWVEMLILLIIATVVTTAWSVLDRRRPNCVTAHKWFRLFARFALGSSLVSYGLAKVVPLQMPYPSLLRLLEPYGDFSPMGALWYSVGASPAYEIFTGSAELMAGVLLFIPRTALLGGSVALMDTVMVFALNMTYDVPVKLFSFHLIILSLVIIAPDARRLANLLLLDRPAGPSTLPPLVRSPRAQRAALAAQLTFGAYLIGMNLFAVIQGWRQFGGGAPEPPLYGIWVVEEMVIDGEARPPLLTDDERWRRLVIPRAESATVQGMDEALTQYAATVDLTAKTLTLFDPEQSGQKALLSFEQPSSERLVLDGEADGRHLHVETTLFDRNDFLLVSRGFHWVQEFPFNR